MSDDELDNVVGGKSYEISYDSEFFNDLGTNCPRYSFEEAAKSNVPYLNVARNWDKFGVQVTYRGEAIPMQYSIKGHLVTRKAAYEYVLEQTDKVLALSAYYVI